MITCIKNQSGRSLSRKTEKMKIKQKYMRQKSEVCKAQQEVKAVLPSGGLKLGCDE